MIFINVPAVRNENSTEVPRTLISTEWNQFGIQYKLHGTQRIRRLEMLRLIAIRLKLRSTVLLPLRRYHTRGTCDKDWEIERTGETNMCTEKPIFENYGGKHVHASLFKFDISNRREPRQENVSGHSRKFARPQNVMLEWIKSN